MNDVIRIQVMGDFTIFVNEAQADRMLNKSRKGLALMQYLIVNRGQQVSNIRLLSTFWQEERVANPENALKTLISRMRATLNQLSDGLGACIVADRGAYHWQCSPNMTVDLYELEDVFSELSHNRNDDNQRRALYKRMMLLYGGNLLQDTDLNEWALNRATALHGQFMSGVYAYVELLKAVEDDKEIVSVCRRALESEPFDERIHIELMRALLKMNRISEAKAQFDEVLHLHYHYLNVKPSKELMEFYNQIVAASKTIDFNLESICKELYESTSERGAFVCEYPVFKEIYNLQIRNLERLGSTMFLGIVMVSRLNGEQMDTLKQESIMKGLMEILRLNLRKGDVITHFSPTMIALLLPTVNYTTGDTVMERLKRKLYQKYTTSNVLFNYRIAPLSLSTNTNQPES